jgi:hypothetical protein
LSCEDAKTQTGPQDTVTQNAFACQVFLKTRIRAATSQRWHFFDGHKIEFQCGTIKNQTQRWFSLGFDDKFEKFARQLTTLFKMEMIYSIPYERVFEIPTPTPSESFDISFETHFRNPLGQTYCSKHWPDCPKEAVAGVQRSAPLNMLSVQEALQETHTWIDAFQNQVSLQHQHLEAQATLARQDQLLSRSGASRAHGVGMTLASLTTTRAVAKEPMILDCVQLEGYAYISMNQGLAIWGHPDIVQASMTATAGAGIGDAAPL